jgi:hypothetical protein
MAKINEATRVSGLNFNVKTTHKWLSKHYSNHYNKEYNETTKIINAHFALTGIEEVLCHSIVSYVCQKACKNKGGIYTITEEQMLDSIKMSPEYDYLFGRVINKYDTNINYINELMLKEESVETLIKLACSQGGNSSTNFEYGAYNLLMYLLLQNRILLANTAYQMMMYGKKSSVDFRAITLSVNIFYKDKSVLYNDITKKLEEISRLLKNRKEPKEKKEVKKEVKEIKEEEEEEEEDEEEEDEEEEEEDE